MVFPSKQNKIYSFITVGGIEMVFFEGDITPRM